ncbi:MAG: DNA polymerase [Acidiferrobacteraceae bacterium]
MNSKGYRTGTYLVLDCETTSVAESRGSALDPANRLLLACGRDNVGKAFYAWGGETDQAALLDALTRYDFVVAHNAKFELQWLRRCGADLGELVVWDTMIAQKVIAGNRPWPLGLDACLAHYGLAPKENAVKTLIHAGVDPEHIPADWLHVYCRQDVDSTRALFLKQLEVMNDAQLALLQTRCELTPVLADIEFAGMGVDAERMDAEYKTLLAESGRLVGELELLAPGVLLTSPKQVAAFLYDTLGVPELQDRSGRPRRTAKGARAADEATLRGLSPDTEIAQKFIRLKLEYAGINSALVKYIDKLRGLKDGDRLRARFNQTVTKTDRLSSSGLPPHNIQFQNMDRGYKRLFKARPGYVLIEADAMQLEFRVAVALSNDAEGWKAILEHRDVHMDTAEVIAGAKWKRMSEGQRKAFRATIKPHTFKPMYGGMSGTDLERKYYKWFQTHYAGIYQTQLSWVTDVVKTGKLGTKWGMVYYWPHARPDESGYVSGQSQMFNYPIQAFATAEIIPIILRMVWEDMQALGLKSQIINTVHDSVIIEALPEEVEIIRGVLIDNFTKKVYSVLQARYGYEFRVPLGVELKIGDHWGEGSEQKYEANL